MTQINVDLILAAIGDVKGDVVEIKEHLERLNGRTRKIESGQATQWVLWSIVGAVLLAAVPLMVGHFQWIP